MSRQTRLHRRGNRYYFRAKVPADLQKAMGKKEIKFSLKTSDYNKAREMIPLESLKINELFENERRKLNRRNRSQAGNEKSISPLPENAIYRIVAGWLSREEKRFTEWYESKGIDLEEEAHTEALDNLRADIARYTGDAYRVKNEPIDFERQIRELLEREGISLSSEKSKQPRGEKKRRKPAGRENEDKKAREGLTLEKDGEVYQKLNSLLRRGNLELALHQEDMLTRGRSDKYEEFLLRHIQPKVNQKPENASTIDDLINVFIKAQKDAKRANSTFRAYQPPIDLLYGALGKDMLLSNITHEVISQVMDLIPQIPVNAKQKYGNKCLVKIIEETRNSPEVERIANTTASYHFHYIKSIFRHAVECKMMKDNPADNLIFKRRFHISKSEKKRRKRKPFTTEELQKIFTAPLYTGCINDFRHYAKVGKNKPRRGRFWIPLIGLFHGLRENEICQLYTEDVKEKQGYMCFIIREDTDEELYSDKSVKTHTSERIVPIHPELLKIGFREHIQKRRKDTDSPLLFPDQAKGSKGYYSDGFQKWFNDRFITKAIGYKPKGTFHSMRGMWNDRLREERVSKEMRRALGGWSDDQSLESHYGEGFSIKLKYEDLSKLKYPELDLSHLYQE